MSVVDRDVALLAEIKSEFPGFRLVRKDQSRWQQLIHRALVIVTLGGMRAYLDGYQTTIGQTIYVTSDWEQWTPDARYAVLRHERVHLRQFRRFTLPGMALLYLLVPLPLGLAYFRARFEKQAYEETLRACAEVYGFDYVRNSEFREHIVRQFLGPSYGWMWPFRRQIEVWYNRVLEGLDAEGDGA